MRAGGAQQQRITIARGLRDVGGADRAASAPPILDDDRLTQQIAQARCDDPGDHIDATTWREWHDDLDGLIG